MGPRKIVVWSNRRIKIVTREAHKERAPPPERRSDEYGKGFSLSGLSPYGLQQ